MRFTVYPLLVMAGSILGGGNLSANAEAKRPPVPTHIPFEVTTDGAHEKHELLLDSAFDLKDGQMRWIRPTGIRCSFARIVELKASCDDWSDEFRIEIRFECLGPEDPVRRFCLETRALDQDGKLLAHDWQVESDGRIGPAEIQLGSHTFVRSRYNSPFNKLSRARLSRVEKLDIRLIEYPRGTPRHFPSGRHQLDLAVSRSNKCGDFELTFANPIGWNLGPPKHQIAFQVFVRDANGKHVRADRRFLMYRADGDYRQSVRVEPKYYESTEISVTVFTRQPDNDKFIRDFFYGGSSGYSGCWTGDGGRLVELPIKGAPLFSDLPEMAAVPASSSASR